jgi:tRNA-dihydrouridine synthase B
VAVCGNNATPASPAIAPGAEEIDTASAAVESGRRGMDPRVSRAVPGFDAPFFQAGLAGYSDAPMRIVARRHGCPYCVTEALLDRTLLAGGRGFAKADLGEIADNVPGGGEDHPLGGQIMGSDPGEMAAAAVKMIEQGVRADREYRALADSSRERGRAIGGRPQRANDERETGPGVRCRARAGCAAPLSFAAIDVNLACPVKKIARKARGGHWLAEPEGAIAILRAVREAVPESIPVTVKMRRSFDETAEMRRNFLRIFDAAHDLGCAWVTVHGRTVTQQYVGASRWEPIRDLVRRNPERVIFGSGDAWEAADIFRMIAYTGVSAAAVARGCIGNPWIFRQARQMMAGEPAQAPTIGEQRAVLEEHFSLALAANSGARHDAAAAAVGAGTGVEIDRAGAWSEARDACAARVPSRGERLTARAMRKFGIRFAAHHPRAEEVRRAMIGVESLDDWMGVLARWYGEEAEG